MDTKVINKLHAGERAFDVDAIIKSAEEQQFYEARNPPNLSNKDRKNLAVLRHNENYVAQKESSAERVMRDVKEYRELINNELPLVK